MDLVYECNKLVIPILLEKLVYRRVLLWLYQEHKDIAKVATFLEYAPGAKSKYPGLRTLLSRVELSIGTLPSPIDSPELLDEEKIWIQTIL